MRKMKLLFFLPFVILAASCNEAEFVEIVKLGGVNKILYTNGVSYGTGEFDIISNVEYSCEQLDGEGWFKVLGTTNEKIYFSYTSNNSFRRQGRVVISYGTRHDTLAVRQEGIYHEYISFTQPQLEVSRDGGQFTVGLQSNLLEGQLQVEELRAYIKDIKLENGLLSFTVPASSRRDAKTYEITVFTVNGWGERVSSTLKVIQEEQESI